MSGSEDRYHDEEQPDDMDESSYDSFVYAKSTGVEGERKNAAKKMKKDQFDSDARKQRQYIEALEDKLSESKKSVENQKLNLEASLRSQMQANTKHEAQMKQKRELEMSLE